MKLLTLPAWALTLKAKLIVGGAILALALYGIRLWGNRQYYEGRDAEKAAMGQQLQEAINRARESARAELEAERALVELERTATASERAAVNASLRQLRQQESKIYATIEATLKEDANRVSQTPAGQLPALIRDLNSRYRAGRQPAQ